MTALESQIAGWFFSTLFTSSLVLLVGWWALRGRLSEIFQTRTEAEERKKTHEGDVQRMETQMAGVREVADKTASRVAVLSTQMQGERDRLTDVAERLRGVDTKVDMLATGQAATTEALKGLGHSLDQLREEIRRRA